MYKRIQQRLVRSSPPLPIVGIIVVSIIALVMGAVIRHDSFTEVAMKATSTSSVRKLPVKKPKPTPTADTPPATAVATPPPASSTSPKTSPTTQGSGTTNDSPYGSRCIALLSQYYTAYQGDLAVERAKHQAALDSLAQHYYAGDYEDPTAVDPNQAYDDYMADVQAENAYWQQMTYSIPQGYNDKLQAAGCAYSV